MFKKGFSMKKYVLLIVFLIGLNDISQLNAAEEELQKVTLRDGSRTTLNEETPYRFYNLSGRRLATSAIDTNNGKAAQWVVPKNLHLFDEKKDWDNCATVFFRKSPRLENGYRIYNMWGRRLTTTAQEGNHGVFAQWVVPKNLHLFDEKKDWDNCATFYLTRSRDGYEIHNFWDRRLAMSSEKTRQGFRVQWVLPEHHHTFREREEWNRAATFEFVPTNYLLKMTSDEEQQEFVEGIPIIRRVNINRTIKRIDNSRSNIPTQPELLNYTESCRSLKRFDIGQSSVLKFMKSFTTSQQTYAETNRRTSHEVEVSAGWSGFGFSASASYRGGFEKSHTVGQRQEAVHANQSEREEVRNVGSVTEIETITTSQRTSQTPSVPAGQKWSMIATQEETTENKRIRGRVQIKVSLRKIRRGNINNIQQDISLEGEDLRNFLHSIYPEINSLIVFDEMNPTLALVDITIPHTVRTVSEVIRFVTE